MGFLTTCVSPKILDSTGHITGGHKKDAKIVVESFFVPMNELDLENKIVDLHMFDGYSVCRKEKETLKVVYSMISFIVRKSILDIICLKSGDILRK